MDLNEFNKIGLNVGAIRGSHVILVGFRLLKKKDKTEEEEAAAQSFKKYFRSICLMTFLFIMAISVTMTVFFPFKGFSGDKRYGTIEGEKIRYIQNTAQYMSIDAYGLGKYNLKDGDKVTLFFDYSTDEIIKAIPTRVHEKIVSKKLYLNLATVILGIIIVIISSIILSNTIGKNFRNYYKNICNE